MNRLLLLFIFLVCMCTTAHAQSVEATSKLFIQILQPERENIPQEAAMHLETKLSQLITMNGIADTDPANRFVLTSKAIILSKDIVSGPPTKVSLNVDFVFMIGDVIENKVFESVTVSSVGVGVNENKAMIAAIKNVKPRNPELVSFLQKAKQDIINYYSLRCAEIRQQAEQAAAAQDFDKAIYLLIQVPDVCDCSEECLRLAIQFNRDKIDMQAASLLNQAKARWVEAPNAEGASAAADILAKIPGGTSSQQGVDALAAEIDAKLKADERKAWAFKMQQYHDNVEKQKRDDQARLEQQRADNEYRSVQQQADNEHRAKQQVADNEYRRTQQIANNEYRRAQQQVDNSARSQLIEACRQVGIEYAKNQPKSVTYQRNLVLW